MNSAVYILRYALVAFCRVYQWIMLATAILSWIPSLRESKLYYILCSFTEPVVRPVRELVYRIPGADGVPIDLSFLAVYFLLSFIIRIVG